MTIESRPQRIFAKFAFITISPSILCGLSLGGGGRSGGGFGGGRSGGGGANGKW